MQAIIINNKMSGNRSYRKARINFSNIFSPESQSLLQTKRSKSIRSDQSKYQSRFNKSYKDTVTNIPNIATFRQTNKIALNNTKAAKMFNRLQMQAEAQQNFDQRVKRKDFYLSYEYNPFTSGLQDNFEEGERQAQQGGWHLVNQYSNIDKKSSDAQVRTKLRQISNNLHNNQHFLQKIVKNLQRKEQKTIKSQVHVGEEKTFQQSSITHQLQLFDRIINLKEQKYRVQKEDQNNIFTILFRNGQQIFRSTQFTLKQNRFCFDSMVFVGQKQQKRFKVNPIIQISTYNRQIIKNIIADNLPQRIVFGPGDININMNQIAFKDIIAIAANKIQSQTLSRFFIEAEAPTKKKAIVEQEKSKKFDNIMEYTKQQSFQKSVNFQVMDQNSINLMYYKQAEYTHIDNVQKQMSKKHIEQLKHFLLEQKKAISNSIRDRRYMKNLQEKKNLILLKHLESNADPRLNQLINQLQRKVRMSKTNKSKAQKVKIDLLCQSLRLKKSMQKDEKSRSPNAVRRKKYCPLPVR